MKNMDNLKLTMLCDEPFQPVVYVEVRQISSGLRKFVRAAPGFITRGINYIPSFHNCIINLDWNEGDLKTG